MNCECNNNSNRVQPRIKHVYGNVLRIAIPLTLRTLVKDGDEVIVTDTDFVPSADHAVRVVFSKGKTNYPIIATMDGNVAIVEDRGKIPVGTYDISVECYDDLGNPYRFKQNAVLCVTDTTSEAGIEEEIEYEAQTWYLNAAVFLATTEIGEIGDVIDVKLQDVFGDAVYDATAKEIRFFDKSGTRLLATIDSRPFVVDGTVEDVYIDVSRQVLVVVLNEDAGGRRFSVPLYLVFNDYYKKGEVDRRIALAMTDAQLQFNQKLPLVVPVTQSGSTISSTMDFGVLNNAIREDGREVVACINNSRFYQLLSANGDEIVFSNVNAVDGFQTLLAVHENNVWALEDVEIGTGGGGGTIEQVQSDWNESDTTDPAYIKNKPTIPAAQIQSDWDQTNTSAKDFIKNKPTIPAKVSDLPNDAGYATTAAMTTALAGKQDTLTFDTTPTANSNKPVTSGGIKTYVDGKETITGITTNQDGTFTIALSGGDTYTVNLNHVHPQYIARKTVENNSDATVTLSADVIYDLGTVAGNKTINLPTTVDAAADYEFRLAYTSGTISGTAISGTTVANDATLTFTAGKTYQVIISGGILYFSETTVSA